jgi:3'(2'), 5'-bisphosphate nucleotidase
VESDDELAIRIAEEAGALLLEMRRAAPAGGPELAAEADRASHELIVSGLRSARPDDVVISEEDDHAMWPWPRPDRQWIVDPLDGTREYGEGRVDFAVHVALVLGGRAVIGAVALPGEGLTLSSGHPSPIPAPPGGATLRFLVSRTRPPLEATVLAELLSADLILMGSAGAKTMAVVRGAGDVYLHSGGQYEWDSAAPVAVALAAGAHASRLDGSPLVYGGRDAWLPDLLICRPEVTQQILDGLEHIR